MKKLLGIMVLGLFLGGNAYAEITTFQCTGNVIPQITWKMNIENKTVHSTWVWKGKVGSAKYKILSINNEKVQLIQTPDSEFYSKKDKPFYWYYGTDFKTVGAKGNVQLYDCSVDGKKVNTPSTGSNSVGISFTIKDKKEQCAAIGFKPATDKFADCVLRLVELDLQKQISNPTIVAQDSGNQAIVDELKRSNNMQQSQFLMNLSNQLLNPSSPASSMSSSSCTVRGGTIKTINCW